MPTSRKKGIKYAEYAAACKSAGTEPMAEAAYAALPEEDISKSVPIADLQQALDAGATVAKALGVGVPTRQEVLAKSLAQGSITDAEKTELMGLLAGDSVDPLAKSLSANMSDDDNKVIDAVPALQSLMKSLDTRLQDMHAGNSQLSTQSLELMKSQQAVTQAMGTALIHVSSELEKSQATMSQIAKRLNIVESAPSTPRAVQTHQRGVEPDLAKSTTADQQASGGGGSISASQVQQAFTDLVKSADADGNNPLAREYMRAGNTFAHSKIVPEQYRAAIRKQLGLA